MITDIKWTARIGEYLVDSESDLAKLPPKCSPGSIAYTADFSSIWQKNNQGTWVRL